MKGPRVFVAAALVVTVTVAGTVEAQSVSEPVYRHMGFSRGDSNSDGTVNLTDAMVVLDSLFRGVEGVPCEAAADADANARVNIGDSIFILSYLSLGGPAPVAPFPNCDAAGTGGLGCAEEPCPEAAGRSFTLYGSTFEADSVVFAIGRSPLMVTRRTRAALVEDVKEAIGGLPPGMPFDLVYSDGAEVASLSSSATPSLTLSTGQALVNSTLDEIFEDRARDDNLEALLTTAIECARRGTGKDRVVIYIGDGWDRSFGEANFLAAPSTRAQAELRAAIRQFNAEGGAVPVHTIGINRYQQAVRAFMNSISGSNGGTFTSGGQEVLNEANNKSDMSLVHC